MYRELYEKIQSSCGYITVILDDEVISEGSCFTFTPDGEVITAAHVVTGRTPIRAEDYNHPNTKIFIKFSGRPLLEYQVSFCCIHIQINAFLEEIQLDIAALAPKQKQDIEFPYLPAIATPPNLGQQVFLAGFSDDLFLPFNFDRILKEEITGAKEFYSAMKKGYMADMMGALIKKATIGNHRRIFAEDSNENFVVEVDYFYLDNGINHGASGGPVVNENGEAIGVISQRAVTSASQREVPNLKVPAGTTIALSLHPINLVAEQWKKKIKIRSGTK